MGEPAGFLITWTCCGTWLYGDARGSVDDAHNVPGTPFLATDDRRVLAMRGRLKHTPTRLSGKARALVEQTIEAHCRVREWGLLAVNARSNHVHVAVRFAGVAPEKMMGELKAWCTRRLREQGLIVAGQPVWTRHGSTRYLWKDGDFDSAVRYVVEGQDADRFGG